MAEPGVCRWPGDGAGNGRLGRSAICGHIRGRIACCIGTRTDGCCWIPPRQGRHRCHNRTSKAGVHGDWLMHHHRRRGLSIARTLVSLTYNSEPPRTRRSKPGKQAAFSPSATSSSRNANRTEIPSHNLQTQSACHLPPASSFAGHSPWCFSFPRRRALLSWRPLPWPAG
jgi:hypothetical protein